MSATVKQNNNNKNKNRFEECQVAPGVRPENDHLTLEAKIAHEIICDHVSPFL
jgi:hypothetical protein